jgi:hypothetical protein
VRVERMLDDASHALAAQAGAAGRLGALDDHRDHGNTLTAATERPSAGISRRD